MWGLTKTKMMDRKMLAKILWNIFWLCMVVLKGVLLCSAWITVRIWSLLVLCAQGVSSLCIPSFLTHALNNQGTDSVGQRAMNTKTDSFKNDSTWENSARRRSSVTFQNASGSMNHDSDRLNQTEMMHAMDNIPQASAPASTMARASLGSVSEYSTPQGFFPTLSNYGGSQIQTPKPIINDFHHDSFGTPFNTASKENQNCNSMYMTPQSNSSVFQTPPTGPPPPYVGNVTQDTDWQNGSLYQTPPSGLETRAECSEPKPKYFSTPNCASQTTGLSLSQNTGRRKSCRPDHYDGTSDWSDYVRHFGTVAIWNDWTDEEKAVQLSMHLSGTARQTCTDSFPEGTLCTDFNLLVKTLNQRFQPEGQEEAYKAEFRNRIKKKSESFMEFGHALRRLVIRSFPQIAYEAREDLVKDQFLMGLTDLDMRKHVSLAHPKNLDQAITLSTEYATVCQSVRTPPPPKPQTVAPVQTSSRSSDEQMADLCRRVDELVQKQSSYYKGPKGVCWNCLKPGHLQRNCPEKDKAKTGPLN